MRSVLHKLTTPRDRSRCAARERFAPLREPGSPFWCFFNAFRESLLLRSRRFCFFFFFFFFFFLFFRFRFFFFFLSSFFRRFRSCCVRLFVRSGRSVGRSHSQFFVSLMCGLMLPPQLSCSASAATSPCMRASHAWMCRRADFRLTHTSTRVYTHAHTLTYT